ncbi:MAG: ribosome-associated translation inhibitor RaiA [Oscillospiraceae bacterium]
MRINTTGRKVSLKQPFIDRVEKRMSKLDKFFTGEAEAQVTVTVEKERQTVEITVRENGFVARSEKTDKQMEIAFDDAIDLLQRRIVKNRKRLGDKIIREAVDTFAAETDNEDIDFDVIREKTFFLKPQTVDDAILEMNMVGHSFFVFKDVESNTIRVVYKRKDGGYGVLIPQ